MKATQIRKHVAKTILSRQAIGFHVVLGWLLTAVGAGLAQSTLQFTADSYVVNEAAQAVTLTVQRLNDTSTAVSVDYATTNGTATNGVKYTATNGSLIFGAGETNKTIAVPILNDGVADGTKTFQVILSNPTNAVLGANSNANVLVADNGVGINFRFPSYPPPAPIMNYPALTEAVGAAVIGIVRGDDGNQAVTVDVVSTDLTATNGVDYLGGTTTVSFAAVERLKFVSIPILNNSVKQPSRSFRLTLSNPIGGILGSTKATTVTISDDDQGLQFESTTYSVGEDAGVALIGVLRGTDETNSAVSVDLATSNVTASHGADYTGLTNTLAFAPDERRKVIAVPILNDGVKETTEGFHLTLSKPTGGAVLGSRVITTVSIQDNDPGVGFELSSYSVWEKAGEATLTVVRGNDSAFDPFTVDFATADVSAKAGQDYQAVSGKLEFQANETVKALRIPILPDSVGESTETFRVTLSNPSGGATLGPATTTVSVLDNDYTVAPPFASQLAIRRASGANILTWTGDGKLQRADQVTGPWQTITATQGPYNVQPLTATTFYRVAPPRPAKLYIPSSYDGQTPMPLVISLHGGGRSGQEMEDWMQFRPLAEARGFLYCYPDGTSFYALSGFGWNASDAASDPATDWGSTIVDDAGYLHDLISEIAQRFAVDRKRVYLVGHSNGGMMAYRMACQFADFIAGIASLAGPMSLDPNQRAPSGPVSILHLNSTADAIAQYWGGAGTPDTGFQLNTTPTQGAVRAIQTWAGYNGASGSVSDPAPSLDLVLDVAGLDTIITRYTNAPPGGAVELWTLIGGPHRPTLSAEFSPRVIDWLLAHPKP